MTINYRLVNLDCANCAAKIEREVSKIKGVNKVSVSFMTTKMIVDLEEDKLEDIEKEIERLVKKLESEVVLKRI